MEIHQSAFKPSFFYKKTEGVRRTGKNPTAAYESQLKAENIVLFIVLYQTFLRYSHLISSSSKYISLQEMLSSASNL